MILPLFAAGGQESAGPVEVEFFHDKVLWSDAWEELTDEYERGHPGVSITNELFNEYIFHLSDQPFVDYFVPAARESATFDGSRLGAAPLLLEGYGYIYNKEIFKEVGITGIPHNFSELKRLCATLQANGVTPFASGFGTWWVIGLHFTNVPMAQQPDPLGFIDNLNAGMARIPRNPVFKDWQNVFDLVLANSEDNPLTVDHHTQLTMFVNGDVAMIQKRDWKQPGVYEVDPDLQMGFAPISFNDDTEKMDRLPVGVPMFLAVNQKSTCAWTFRTGS